MAAIPLIEPEARAGGLPGAATLDPGGYAALSTSGLKALAAAGSTVASEAEKTYQTYAAAQKEIRNQQILLETERNLGVFDRQAADAVIKVRQDPSITPDQYASRVEQELRSAKSGIEKTIKTPEVLPRFQIGAERRFNTLLTKAKYEGLEQQLALNTAAVGLLNDRDQNTAVFAVTPEERQAAVERITERTDRQLRTRGYTAEQYRAEMKRNFSNIEEGEVRRDFRDPTKRAQVIDDLATGRKTTMAPDKQLQLAKTLQDQADLDDKKAQEKVEKDRKFLQVKAMREMSTRAADKTTTLAEIRTFADTWDLTVEQKEHLEKVLAAPVEEAASNPAVLADVMIRAHRYAPTISEDQIRRLYKPDGTGLNTKDTQALLDHVTSRRTHLTEYGQTLSMQQYNQGEQELMLGLGIVPGQIDSLTKESKQALSLAMREYSERAFPKPGRRAEDAFAVKNELVNRYQTVVNPIGLTSDAIRNSLRYPVHGMDIKSNPDGVLSATGQAIEQNKARLGDAGYKAEKEKWFKMKDAVEADGRKRTAPGAPQTGSGGTAPKNPVGAPSYNRAGGKALESSK